MPRPNKRPRTYTSAVRARLRKHLHAQLDALLNGRTEEDGKTLTVIDSMTARAIEGFYFNVRVHSLHPSQTTVKEAEGTVKAGPEIGLTKEGA